MKKWRYKFVLSERCGEEQWRVIRDDDEAVKGSRLPIKEYMNKLGEEGWELVSVVPAGITELTRDRILKHILKRQM